MSEIKNINDYNEIVNGDKPVLLDFYADWCGPCQTLLPIVNELAETHKDDFVVAKVNVDKNRELAFEYGVRSIPALFFVTDGEVQEKLVGLQTKDVLNDKIKSYLPKVAI